jgi:hypothetical protein
VLLLVSFIYLTGGGTEDMWIENLRAGCALNAVLVENLFLEVTFFVEVMIER